MDARETPRATRSNPAWAVINVITFMSILWISLYLIGEVIRLIRPNLLTPLGPFAICVSEFILTLISVGLAYCFLRKDFPKFLTEIKLKNKQALIEIAAGFLFGTIMLGIMFGITYLSGGFTVSKVNWPVNVFPGLGLYLIAGFTEEWIFRGFIFRTLEKSAGTIAAVLISSILFGFAHVVNMPPSAAPAYIFYACTLLSFEAGLPLAGAYLLRRSLWLPVGIHWAWNFLEGTVFGVSVSGTDPGATILTSKMVGNDLLSGGVFGPEASLPFFAVGSLVGIGLLYVSYKKGNWSFKVEKDTVPVLRKDL
ncbi:MAG: type II CAAX endopeptidase family protein [Candidatus Melainabacteria bacterium]|nr:type II CAAX endopeptidase family protein [Candidatus Melainabacteria bacterium]